jgi:hypothetical protein
LNQNALVQSTALALLAQLSRSRRLEPVFTPEQLTALTERLAVLDAAGDPLLKPDLDELAPFIAQRRKTQ